MDKEALDLGEVKQLLRDIRRALGGLKNEASEQSKEVFSSRFALDDISRKLESIINIMEEDSAAKNIESSSSKDLRDIVRSIDNTAADHANSVNVSFNGVGILLIAIIFLLSLITWRIW